MALLFENRAFFVAKHRGIPRNCDNSAKFFLSFFLSFCMEATPTLSHIETCRGTNCDSPAKSFLFCLGKTSTYFCVWETPPSRIETCRGTNCDSPAKLWYPEIWLGNRALLVSEHPGIPPNCDSSAKLFVSCFSLCVGATPQGCNVLQCVAVCCNMLRVAVRVAVAQYPPQMKVRGLLDAKCCSALQYFAVAS